MYQAMTACHKNPCFSFTTAAFLAYHLHYFSTFLVYLPFTLICIPALTILDATYLSSWDRWAAWRRHRFWICALWCLFILFAPTYPSSFPLSKHTPIPPITSSKNGTYFIAANLYNSAKVLPSWTKNMKLIIKHIGPSNVFISIYESNSQDGTQEMLRKFKDELVELGVENEVVTEEGTRGRWGLNSPARISYMAGIRNKVLEPLRVMGDQGGRVSRKLYSSTTCILTGVRLSLYPFSLVVVLTPE
jgi:alpha-1,3-mannosyltransferase